MENAAIQHRIAVRFSVFSLLLSLAPGHALRDRVAGQLAQGVAADPAGRAGVGRLEALGGGDGRRVQLGAALPDLADSPVHGCLPFRAGSPAALALGGTPHALARFSAHLRRRSIRGILT